MMAILLGLVNVSTADSIRPNIIWIVAEDASPHIGCYGETTIQTPNLDRMASRGVKFTKAFVTCPVCSPSRSAMVTGMYQSTLGAHNHRSQAAAGKGGGTPAFHQSYQLPIKSIPRLFKDAGYFTCNSATGKQNSKFGKTDYNFIWDRSDYDGADWASRAPGQPFFAQIQLKGGKNRSTKHNTDPAEVTLPPYYPDHPVLREDWAAYLNSWIQTDLDVAQILKRIRQEGISDSTAVFFWTDHGVSHARGKQFLYDEGIHVPLLVHVPGKRLGGTVRSDLVTQIDIAATSLAMAGITIPGHVQGVDVFHPGYQPRKMIFSARDRCDETVEIQRCVRTSRYKYIRNFLPHLPHLQPNQYKDGKTIIQTIRSLYAAKKLNELQSRVLTTPRPAEELYDLQTDPGETVNLANDKSHHGTLKQLRSALYDWMVSSGDLGLIPEPILEEMGAKFGSKYHVLAGEEHRELTRRILTLIDDPDLSAATAALTAESPPLRYWAVTILGIHGNASHRQLLTALCNDSSSGVRVAAALAICRLGDSVGSKVLAAEIGNKNLLTGMYAIRALELTGPMAAPHRDVIRSAMKSRYEFTRRIATRLNKNLAEQ